MSFLISALILIGIFVLLGLYVYTLASKKETLPERMSEAVSIIAHETADKVSSVAYSIAEPKDKKKLRLAKEELARRNSLLFRSPLLNQPDQTQRCMVVDDRFRESLKTIGLEEEEWKKLAVEIYHLGRIMEVSYLNDPSFTNETSKSTRESIINNTIADSISWDYIHDAIVEALNYFDIDIKEWVEYGPLVLRMHHVFEDGFHKEFGLLL